MQLVYEREALSDTAGAWEVKPYQMRLVLEKKPHPMQLVPEKRSHTECSWYWKKNFSVQCSCAQKKCCTRCSWCNVAGAWGKKLCPMQLVLSKKAISNAVGASKKSSVRMQVGPLCVSLLTVYLCNTGSCKALCCALGADNFFFGREVSFVSYLLMSGISTCALTTLQFNTSILDAWNGVPWWLIYNYEIPFSRSFHIPSESRTSPIHLNQYFGQPSPSKANSSMHHQPLRSLVNPKENKPFYFQGSYFAREGWNGTCAQSRN